MVNKPDTKTLVSWVHEAMLGHSGWRQDAWEDAEFKDGIHWTQADYERLVEKGINPITINRIFPILNLVNGNFIRNQKDIIAKGRTKQDHELSQVMSEILAYVVDQNKGIQLQRSAFDSEITVGYGCLYVGFNADPRREKIWLKEYDWYNIWWDPYGSPWMLTDNCRYVFTAEWKNLDDLIMLFPEKKKDIEEQFKAMEDTLSAPIYDIATEIENFRETLASSSWVNTERRRVRPVEIWYTTVEPTWFAIMPDGMVFELDKYSIEEQVQIARAAQELQKTHVKKMNVATLLGELELQNISTPFPHDEFPFVPYVGYLDRYKFPYGIPRQIKEQNMEVNKRRSMGLALINSRRTIVEDGAAEDLNVVYDEANRLNSFIVLNKGKLNAIQIEDMSALAAPQVSMMLQSEQEIKEIVGANDEVLGLNTPAQSNISLEKKRQMASTMTLSLLENAYYSQKLLGERILSLVQSTWTSPKVMRVIDRLSGVEKFIEINQRVFDPERQAIVVKNDITQGRFDLVVTTAELTDTMREKNLDLLFSAINKAPPEAVAPLLNVAFEISDIPEKERILAQIREATGLTADDEDLSIEERKARQRQKAQEQQAQQYLLLQKELESKAIADQEKQAKAKKALDEGQAALILAQAQKQKVDQEGFKAGYELLQQLKENVKGGEKI